MSWKRSNEEVILKTPWHEYKKFDFETETGARGKYYYLETPGSVYILPRHADGSLTMVHSYRCLPNTFSYEFPGGAIKKGQTPAEAAIAELAEEAGFKAGRLIPLGTLNPCSGVIHEVCHVFLAEHLTPVPRDLEPTEHMSLVQKTAQEIDEMIARGEIFDGQTLAAWALYARHR